MNDQRSDQHSRGAPGVSVLMVSYNQRRFVADALESAIVQSYPNLEIVIADDASTDGTANIVADYAARYPQLIKPIFNRENLGVTRNCNVALEQCTGKYIAFLAGDDLFLPGKISRQVAWFQDRQERVLCGHQAQVFYQDGSRPPHPFSRMMRFRRGTGAARLIRYGAYCSSSLMVRSDKIPPHGFDESVSLVSDYMLCVDVLADGGEFGSIPGTYTRYRRHGSNVSNDVPRNVVAAARALHEIARRYPQYAPDCRWARGRFLHYQLGLHYLGHGDKNEARRAFLAAIAADPLYPRAWIGLLKSVVAIRA